MGNKKVALKVENISIRFNLSKEKVDTFWKTLKTSLENGEKVKFKDWGNFEMKEDSL